MRVVGMRSLLLCLVLTTPAAAQVVHPGPQAAPPVLTPSPVLHQALDGRRAVRGCDVDERCGRGDEAMREIEVELFPPPGGDPWLDERRAAGSRLEPGAARTVTRPSELRPDAPWLDQIELSDLPVRWSQKLVDYLVFYRDDPRGRAIMTGWLRAQGRYRDMISRHLRKARLPQDLMYVSMIESSYNPTTRSYAGALGLWQFMPDAGRIYGLRQDRWVDERRDPYRSTIAQLDYFRDLYQRFGDWNIALASFNVGYGAMLRSIARYNTNDYYKLCEYENGVPWETCLYTPKVLATALVGNNRALFGYDKLEVDPPEVWDEIAVPVSLTLATLARAASTTEAEIKRLNPHLRRDRTPPGEAGYIVRVPRGHKADTQRRLVELQTEWDGYDAYVVAHGERFEDVATTYGISTYKLRKLNGVEHESEISGGTVLVVPRISAEQRTKNRATAKAKLLGSGVDHQEGEQLIVPVLDKDQVVDGHRRVFYRVVTGDSLSSIASAFGTRSERLATWNGLALAAHLHPRMVLAVWVPRDFDAVARRIALLDQRELIVVNRGSEEHLDLAEERTGRVRVEYVAAASEKLADVAKRYGMGSHDLARINRISYNTVLAKGDKIVVYQVVDPKRSGRAESQWKKAPRARRGKVVKRTSERAAAPAEKPAAEKKSAAEKPAAEKQSAEKKPAAEKPAAEKPSEKKPAAEKPASEKKPAAEKPAAAKKPAAEKPAVDKQVAVEKPAPVEGPVTSPAQLR